MVTNKIQKKWELEIKDDPEASVSVYEVDISDINQKKVQIPVQNGKDSELTSLHEYTESETTFGTTSSEKKN